MNTLKNEAKEHDIKNKHNMKKIIKIANIMLLVAAFLLGFSSNKAFAAEVNPFDRIADAVSKIYKANTVYATDKTKMSIDMPEIKEPTAKMAVDLMKNISIESKTKINNVTKEAYCDAVFGFNNNIKLNAKVYTDGKNVVISMPQLYDKTFYFNLNDLNGLNNNPNVKVGPVNVDDYKKVFALDNSKESQEIRKTYSDLLNKSVSPLIQTKGDVVLNIQGQNGEKSTVKCNDYAVNMTLNQANAILNNVFAKVADDSNVKNLVKSRLNEFFTAVDKNNDYSKFGLTKESVNQAKGNFDKFYNDMIANLKNAVTKINQSYEIKINDILIDSQNVLRGFNTDMNVKVKGIASYNIKNERVINSINEKVTIEKLTTDGGLNIFKANKAEIDAVNKQIEGNAIKLFTGVK